ncbi:MAG: hypothetical protein ACLSHW_07775 [Lachnospiraceae bacterium]
MTVKRRDREPCQNMIFAAAMNLRAEGGGVPMAPDSTPYDGNISLSSASGIPKWKTFFLLPLLALGKQGGINGFDVKDGIRDRAGTGSAGGGACGWRILWGCAAYLRSLYEKYVVAFTQMYGKIIVR